MVPSLSSSRPAASLLGLAPLRKAAIWSALTYHWLASFTFVVSPALAARKQ